MSIATQLQALENNISDAYNMVSQRGGTLPQRKNMENLDDAIATIPSGGGGGLVIPKDVEQSGKIGPKTSSYTFSAQTATDIPEFTLAHAFSRGITISDCTPGGITELDLRNVTVIGQYALHYCCFRCTGLTTLRLDNLKYGNAVSGIYCGFLGCTGLTGTIDLSKLNTNATAQNFLNSTFQECANITGVNLGAIATISGSSWMAYAFNQCSNLSEVNMDSLTTVSGNSALSGAFSYTKLASTAFLKNLTSVTSSSGLNEAFSYCTSLTTASFPKLTTLSGGSSFSNTFLGCTSLTSVSLPLLNSTSTASQVFQNCFSGCTALTTVSFQSLATIKGSQVFRYAFRNCTSLTSVSFPALTTSSFGSYTNTFNQMLIGCSNVTVHFPAAIQGKIGSWTDVVNGFGGTNTTVLFDL